MIKQRRGRISNIASLYAVFGSAFARPYSAAEGAVVQLTKSMAIGLPPFNVQVNALAPGSIETGQPEFMKTTPVYQDVTARTPAGRWAHPDECAGAAVFLAPRASDFVTVSTLLVDGGYATRRILVGPVIGNFPKTRGLR